MTFEEYKTAFFTAINPKDKSNETRLNQFKFYSADIVRIAEQMPNKLEYFKKLKGDLVVSLQEDSVGYLWIRFNFCEVTSEEFVRRLYSHPDFFTLNHISDFFFKYLQFLLLEEEIKELETIQAKDIKLFISDLSKTKLIAIKDLLVKEKLLAETTDTNFLYWFGKSLPENPGKLNWLSNKKTALALTMKLICKEGSDKKLAIRCAFGLKDFNTKWKEGALEYNLDSKIKTIIAGK